MQPQAYKRYLLLVLALLTAVGNADASAVGILLQGIKVDLHLSDTQIGVIFGLAFGVFHTLVTVPMARWADRGNRVRLLSVTTLLWATLYALSAATHTFYQLLAVRVCMAVAETGNPAALSLLADYYDREERPRALATVTVGGSLGALLGLLVAGWLNQFYGWRTTYVLLSLPGIVLPVVAWTTLREPRRESPTAQSQPVPPLREVGTVLWKITSLRHLVLAVTLSTLFSTGMSRWVPTFFIRTYGLTTGQLGTWLALIGGVSGMVGIYAGGALASSRYARRNERLQLSAGVIVFCVLTFVTAGVFVTSHLYVAFALLSLVLMGGGIATAPAGAMIQTLVPPRMRAIAVGLLSVCVSLIGGGLGSLVAATLSDALRPKFGEDSLRYALLISCAGFFWAAWHWWRASRYITADLELARLQTSVETAAQMPATGLGQSAAS